MIEEFAALVSESLHSESGEVFYSGRAAFSQAAEVYILGANPGSDPSASGLNTIGENIDLVLNRYSDQWSSYVDESWNRRASGGAPLQRRLQHLANSAGLDLRLIPSSNLVFQRSTRTAELKKPLSALVETCWPFHAAVLAGLRPRAILCLGVKAGEIVLSKLGGGSEIDCFVEENRRRWASVAWRAESGHIILGLSHPSIADWVVSATDPSPLVIRTLSQ